MRKMQISAGRGWRIDILVCLCLLPSNPLSRDFFISPKSPCLTRCQLPRDIANQLRIESGGVMQADLESSRMCM